MLVINFSFIMFSRNVEYLEMAIVILSVITLSEANMYALLSNYYRIFHKYKPEDWKIPHIAFWKKCILFCHAFFSLGIVVHKLIKSSYYE